MAYICNLPIPCKLCEHYKYDEDRQRMACFAQQDELEKRSKADLIRNKIKELENNKENK